MQLRSGRLIGDSAEVSGRNRAEGHIVTGRSSNRKQKTTGDHQAESKRCKKQKTESHVPTSKGFLDLPAFLLVQILSYVCFPERVRSSRTSKAFYTALMSPQAFSDIKTIPLPGLCDMELARIVHNETLRSALAGWLHRSVTEIYIGDYRWWFTAGNKQGTRRTPGDAILTSYGDVRLLDVVPIGTYDDDINVAEVLARRPHISTGTDVCLCGTSPWPWREWPCSSARKTTDGQSRLDSKTLLVNLLLFISKFKKLERLYIYNYEYSEDDLPDFSTLRAQSPKLHVSRLSIGKHGNYTGSLAAIRAGLDLIGVWQWRDHVGFDQDFAAQDLVELPHAFTRAYTPHIS